jgi:hypothetical protein
MAKNFGCGINQLKRTLKSFPADDTVYLYVVASIKKEKTGFVQTGSGPNFLGDVVTLCTCKHLMRTFRSTDKWEHRWIAGFCDVDAGCGQHLLVYLMRVADAFESHRELWQDLSPLSKAQKNARVNPLGDVYEPKVDGGDAFDISNYYEPVRGHSHHRDACDGGWHRDINYAASNRLAALLVGSPSWTFLWDRPRVQYRDSSHPLGRGQKKLSLGDFLRRLGA